MAPRRPDRITRSGASQKIPVSIPVVWGSLSRMVLTTIYRCIPVVQVTPRRNKQNTDRRSPTIVLTINSGPMSQNVGSGPAENLELDDICSDLSSLPPTPRNELRQLESDSWVLSHSANTSSEVESGVAPWARATLPDVPTLALRATDEDTGRLQGLPRTLMRDVAASATHTAALPLLLDRQNRTPRHILLWTTRSYYVL
jgi:hypothetical protein